MVFIPGDERNPLDTDDYRVRRLDARDFGRSRRWVIVACGGAGVLIVFGCLAALGLPGTGLVLVPVGLGMLLGGGIQLLLDRISG